jgi:hypothetical protein
MKAETEQTLKSAVRCKDVKYKSLWPVWSFRGLTFVCMPNGCMHKSLSLSLSLYTCLNTRHNLKEESCEREI